MGASHRLQTSFSAGARGSFSRAADLFGDVNAWDERAVDEMDYERRLRGYQALDKPQWQVLGRRKVRVGVGVGVGVWTGQRGWHAATLNVVGLLTEPCSLCVCVCVRRRTFVTLLLSPSLPLQVLPQRGPLSTHV